MTRNDDLTKEQWRKIAGRLAVECVQKCTDIASCCACPRREMKIYETGVVTKPSNCPKKCSVSGWIEKMKKELGYETD